MLVFVFFKQNTAYEMRISDWSSDVCSSDLGTAAVRALSCVCRLALDPAASVGAPTDGGRGAVGAGRRACRDAAHVVLSARLPHPGGSRRHPLRPGDPDRGGLDRRSRWTGPGCRLSCPDLAAPARVGLPDGAHLGEGLLALRRLLDLLLGVLLPRRRAGHL